MNGITRCYYITSYLIVIFSLVFFAIDLSIFIFLVNHFGWVVGLGYAFLQLMRKVWYKIIVKISRGDFRNIEII